MRTCIHVLSAAPDLMVRSLRAWIRREGLPLRVRRGGELRISCDAPCVCDQLSPASPVTINSFDSDRPATCPQNGCRDGKNKNEREGHGV